MAEGPEIHRTPIEEREAIVPWEDRDRPWLYRLFGTLADAFRPIAAAPTLGGTALAPGVVFALITALPLVAASGIIPYTHHIRFGPSFAISLLHEPTSSELALDVAQAIGISLFEKGLIFGLFFACYVSLTRAYGGDGAAGAATRTLLYRGFLLALGADGILVWLIMWGLSGPEPSSGEMFLAVGAQVVPMVLLFISMRNAAHLGGGVSLGASYVVTALPFVLLLFVAPFIHEMLAVPFMPDAPPAP